MSVYLSSFYPLCCTILGRKAIINFPELKPFIDGSCRREPDFEHDAPSITGLCRPGFAKKLAVGDIVIYMSNKMGIGLRKLVAILEVTHKMPDHDAASRWYEIHNLAIPNNLMVDQTQCFPIFQTHQFANTNDVSIWNREYKNRSKRNPVVAICKYWNNIVDVEQPMPLTDDIQNEIFGRIPVTRNPPQLSVLEWTRFQEWLTVTELGL
jgi:hypothetical protein